MQSLYKFTLLLLLIPSVLFSANGDKKKHEKSKTIKKEYLVNADAEVRLKNKYGNISISTWKENRVAIEVKIIVKGDDLDDVLERLDDITINFNSGATFVDAETIIEKKKSGWNWFGKSNKVNFKILYVVKMPETNSVYLNQKYGNIYLDKLSGEANISCDYGKINVGQLKNVNNVIDLDYCSTSTIDYVKNAEVTLDYSKLTIEKSNHVKLNADYSNFYGGEINNVNFNTDYGTVNIQDIINLDGNGDYTNVTLGKVSKNLILDTDYGAISIKELAKGFDSVSIDASYTGIKINSAKNTNFKFSVDLQYGNFRYDKDLTDIYKSSIKTTRKSYEGVFGKGKAKSSLKIRSKYGSVTIN